MPYVDPGAITTGTAITSTWGNAVRNATQFLANPPACRVYRTTAQSITNGTLTVVTFDAERYDTDSMHSTSTNTSRITINTAGLYLVTANIEFGADADYTRHIIDILLNGTTIIARHSHEFAQNLANPQLYPISTVYKFTATQYIEVRVFQQNTSAGANNVGANGNYTPEFSATWIGLG